MSKRQPYGLLILLLLVSCATLCAQQPPQAKPTPPPAAATPQNPAAPAIDFAALVASEFGPTFKLDAKQPPIMLDVNGDGREDLVLVVSSREVLGASEKFHYAVQDPYGKYFGYSNPSMSMQFSVDPAAARHLLIVEDWRGAKSPKFVLVNIPFEKLSAGYMLLKKKTVQAIETEDEIGIQAAIYWDGKRFHWEAVGMNQSK